MHLKSPQDVGLLLQSRRKNLRWSQAYLAGKLGISRQWVIALEKGTPGVAIGTVFRAFNILELTVNANPREERSIDTRQAVTSHEIDDIVERARASAANYPLVALPPLPLSKSTKRKGTHR